MCYYLVNDVIKTVPRLKQEVCRQPNDSGLNENFTPQVYQQDVQDNITCQFCVNIITHLKCIVSSKETEAEFKLILSKICTHLGSFRNECVNMLDQNLEDIFNYLRNVINPEGVCKDVGACLAHSLQSASPLPSIEEVINLYPVPYEKIDYRDAVFKSKAKPYAIAFGPQCFLCKKVFEYVYNYIKEKENKTDEVIIEALDKVCDEIFSDAAERQKCKNFIKTYVTDIIYYIKMAAEPEIACSLMGFCVAMEFKPVEPVHLQKPDCILCKKIMQWIYDELKDERTREAIEQALDRVCDKIMPSKDVEKCRQLVKEYTEEIINVVTTVTTAPEACELLGFCASVKISSFLEIEKTVIMDSGFKPVKESHRVKPDCILCKQIMKWVYDQLKDNKTEEAIREALDEVCEKVMPSAEVQKCKDFIDKYVDQIINIIISATDPDEACQLLGLCTNIHLFPFTKIEHSVAIIPFVKIERTATKVVNRFPVFGALCDICRQVFSRLNSLVTNPKLRENVIAALDKVCDSFLPDSKKSECRDFVEKYTNEIIDVIAKETDPELACSMLRLCKFNKIENRVKVASQKEVEETRKPVASIRDDFCYVCHITAHFIQEELYNVKNEEAIRNYIEKHVCGLLPTVDRNLCDSYINEYGAQIEQLIAQKLFDPTVLCDKMLRICPAPNNTQDVNVPFELIKPSKEKICKICMKAVDRLDQVLQSFDHQSVEKNISLIAATACKVFPKEESLECSKIVNTYGSAFLELNKDLTDSRQVCKSVDLCFIPGQPHLLGGHKCTYGPDYWCHTAAHADACKATAYCKHKYWKPIQ
ncbi:saposin-like protein [Dinothrombium tinctorium]|uniref:Saposin-like protein n=1 Tax=Dinothrombium tinctorium TaxID=1965070 RepID=A0A3S3SJW8_9ACAR|nr:saposin-like protein [Dinothrombium tinctorium]